MKVLVTLKESQKQGSSFNYKCTHLGNTTYILGKRIEVEVKSISEFKNNFDLNEIEKWEIIVKTMSFNEYQEKAVATAIYGAGNSIIYPALGLGNEAGEVLGKIKKVLRDNAGEFDNDSKAKISDEIGDVLWYMAALCRDLGISMEDVASNNLAKLADRQSRNVIQGSGDNR